jgi:hypothetical protein
MILHLERTRASGDRRKHGRAVCGEVGVFVVRAEVLGRGRW